MSTMQHKSKRVAQSDQPEADARSIPPGSGWGNFIQGMGSVLELFPSGDVCKPLDPDEALARDMENVNRALCTAFERLKLEYEETAAHAVNPQIDFPPAAGSS